MADGIDPNIALSYRPPNLATMPNLQIQTPLESLARVVSLRSLMQEGELKGLQLQQLKQQMAEQQALSKLFASAYGTDTTQTPTQPVVPVQPNLPTPPPVQPTPAGGTMPAQGAYSTPPATSGPAGGATGPTQITPWGSPTPTLAPQPATLPLMAPVTAQQPQIPVTAPAAASPFGPQFPTPGQILRAAPLTGMAVVKQLTDQQKDLLDLHIKNQTDQKNQIEDMVRLANGSQDNDSFQRNMPEAASKGYITPDQARYYMGLGFDDPKTQAWLHSTRMQLVSADKQLEMKLALAKDAREGKMFEADYGTKLANQRQAEYTEAAQAASDLTDKSQLPGWLAERGPYAVQRYGYLANSNLPLEQIKQVIQMGAGGGQKAAEAGATTRATEEAKYAAQLKEDEPLIQGVLNGTIKWENIPPATQERIQSEVQRRQQAGATPGGTPGGAPAGKPGSPTFGKPISDAQRTQLGNYDRAMTILNQTEADLNNPDKTSTMGPIVGDIANLRWAVGTRNFRDALVARALQLKNYLTSTGRVNPEIMKLVDQVFPTIKTQPEEAMGKIHQLQEMIRAERASAIRDMGGLAIPDELKEPPSFTGGSASSPPATPPPAPPGQQQPPPQPVPAPSKQAPPAAKIPADVQTLLKNGKAGRYRLTDGRIFYKKADGTIVPAQ